MADSYLPLFMQSGTIGTPNEAQVDMNDPFERAAYRQRATVRPPLGRQEGNLGPQMLASLVPGGAAMRVVAAAPKATAAALAGLGLLGSTSGAGEDQFNWTDPDAYRTKRIDDFNSTINNLNREMRAASKARMPSVQKQMDALIAERDMLLGQRAKERDSAFVTWQQEQQAAREAAEAKRQSETSLLDRVPGLRASLVPATGALAFMGGRFAGRRLSAPAAISTGAGMGAAEGAAMQIIPTEMDALGLPVGSPTQERAANSFFDPAYWGRVGLSAAGGAVAGGIGAGKAAIGRRDPLPRVSASPTQPTSPGLLQSPMPTPMASPAPTAPIAAQSTAQLPRASASVPQRTGVEDLIYDPGRKAWIRPDAPEWAMSPELRMLIARRAAQ